MPEASPSTVASSPASPGAAPQGPTSGQAAENAAPPPGQNNDLLREHAAKAQAIVDRERVGLPVESNREQLMDGRHQDDEPVAGKPRAADGKFKPKAEKEKALLEADPTIEKTEGEKPESKEKPTAAVLKHLQDLVSNGRADEAAKMIGLDIDKGPRAVEFARLREERRKSLALVDQRKSEATQAYQHVERVATNLEQQYGRFRAAEQAYRSGDFDKAHHLAFGESVDDYNRKALSQMATRDPRVAQLEAQLAGFQRQQVELHQRASYAQQQAAQEQERANYMSNLTKELGEIEDPRIAKAMEKASFVDRVFKVQAKNYDASSDETISPSEAAELALQELELEYGSLRSVFDEDTDIEEGPRGAKNPASVSRGTPTRPVRPAKHTHLRSQEAAEAHAATRPAPGSRELLDAHIRRTQEAIDREKRRVG